MKKSLELLKEIRIENLWIVVDEIEDITDTERDGLPSEDRGKGIDQALLTVIPRVIKQEELRQGFDDSGHDLLAHPRTPKSSSRISVMKMYAR